MPLAPASAKDTPIIDRSPAKMQRMGRLIPLMARLLSQGGAIVSAR